MCGTTVDGGLYLRTSCATAYMYFIYVSCSEVISASDFGDQISVTSSLTLARTSGCESKNATAHNSDDVDASCAAKRKSKR
ncbi:hypothetical protein P8452_55114 [Trifolium repens]|nr:hypothetical protein P8452_55114 [Trifolium repens]